MGSFAPSLSHQQVDGLVLLKTTTCHDLSLCLVNIFAFFMQAL